MLKQSNFAAALFSASLLLCIHTSGASAGTVVLTDDTFNSMTVGGSYTSDPAMVVSYSAPCPTCGQGGVPALQVVIDLSGASNFSYADVGFIDNNLGTYNPSTQGAISSISASVYKNITTTGDFASSTYTNTFHPLIFRTARTILPIFRGHRIPPPVRPAGTYCLNPTSQQATSSPLIF